MKTETLTSEILRSRLNYDEETGVFTRLYCEDFGRGWNARYAGKLAGSIWVDHKRDDRKCWHIELDKVKYKAHRLAWLYCYGRWPMGDIDHKNGNPLDNRIQNLREATSSENSCNKGKYRNNSSGLKGVASYGRGGKYRAYINREGKRHHLGVFGTTDDAHAAYRSASEKLHGEFARCD